ncbi:unnamed protein product [Clonostachys byssicola]|uniref:Uncharacterized protein n=1 Tax=Clonostachys byssicola TaxID=160290 RepID=A0A9N9UMM3_9HYPO|nr:unnamed protein product [Clonostachys byssicola]
MAVANGSAQLAGANHPIECSVHSPAQPSPAPLSRPSRHEIPFPSVSAPSPVPSSPLHTVRDIHITTIDDLDHAAWRRLCYISGMRFRSRFTFANAFLPPTDSEQRRQQPPTT